MTEQMSRYDMRYWNYIGYEYNYFVTDLQLYKNMSHYLETQDIHY